ncbi:MAG TPA: histidinol-phosphatase [Planctomycetota bacterium]|nr:histidinol-phosphatase [Planctomycetota bacterium]
MSRELAFALAAAREAGAATLHWFGSEHLGVETKGDGTPVTRADREAERILVERIRGTFPDDGILGEETGERRGASDRRWILDPIDGTKSFVHGVPLYGTLVALEVRGAAVLGVIFLPALRETVFAARGDGAHWARGLGEGETTVPARVSTVDRLDQALLCTTSARGFERSGHTAFLERIRGRAGTERGWGDCYGHALVATGRAEVMLDPVMAIWDCAALQPILEEAGGRFTDFAGTPTHRGGSAISTNLALADQVRVLARG